MGIYINKNGTAERYDGAPSAAGQSYNNASSGLSATNTQAAIDEIVSEKTDNTNLGTVELTTTATAAHAVGTYFILGGQFVKTTVAIGVGDTITVGTNVEATNIGSVLTTLNSNIAQKASKEWTVIKNNIVDSYWDYSGLTYSEYCFVMKNTNSVFAQMIVPAALISNNITLKYITDNNVHERFIKEGTNVRINDSANIGIYGIILAR